MTNKYKHIFIFVENDKDNSKEIEYETVWKSKNWIDKRDAYTVFEDGIRLQREKLKKAFGENIFGERFNFKKKVLTFLKRCVKFIGEI